MSAVILLLNSNRYGGYRPPSDGGGWMGCLGVIFTIVGLAIGIGGIIYVEWNK